MPTAPPLISIALCTYNGAAFLPVQLDSLLAQDWENLEIVVVDDGSTDGTRQLLLDYAARDARISVHLNERNLGFLLNFQRAFGLSRGEFIAPCDQDDWWHPGKLRGLHNALGDRALAYCDSLLVDAAGASTGQRVSEVLLMYEGSDPAALLFGNCVSGHAMLVRRSLVERAMPFPEGCFHDWWLAFAALSTEGLVYVPEPWVHYRQHGATQTDLADRARRERKRPPRWAEMDRRGAWFAALARFPSPHQPFFQALQEAYEAWSRSWICPRLPALLLARGRQLFPGHPKALAKWRKRSKHFFWGLKAKRLLIPWRYRP